MASVPDGFELHRWRPEEVARFWDFISMTQPDTYFSHRVGSNVAWYFRRLLAPGVRVVDYGCGTGRFLEEVLKYPCNASGFETSSASREAAAQRLSSLDSFGGVFGDEALAQERGTFDVAFCIEVVEHLYDDQLAVALDQLRQLLRPGGTLVVTTPDDEDLSASWICNPVTGTVFHRWQHVRNWNRDSLSHALKEAGFEVRGVRSVHPEAVGRDLRSVAMRLGFATVRRSAARTLFAEAERR